MLTEVLHQRPGRPSWLVGETKAERVERMRSEAESDSSRWYRDSYPRRVVSVRSVADVESGKLPTLRNMAGDMLGVRVMDLDDEERQGAASGALKVQGNRLVPVTFDDRLGAVATKLRARHSDPEQWEIDEKQRVETEETENETRRLANDRDDEEYRVRKDDFPRELHQWSLTEDGDPPAFPERPKPRRLREVAPSSFDREVMALAKSLAPTVTRTGTGLYSAKVTPTQLDRTQAGAPAGQVVTFTTGGLGVAAAFAGGYITNVTRSETRAIVSHIDDRATLEGSLTNWLDTDDLDIFDAWSTIQAALDQLFTDQGTATFTASQYIRVFAGTYDENVVPSTSLNTGVAAGALLIIEGDPSAIRTDIHLAPAAGQPLNINNDFEVLVRHMKITRADAGAAVTLSGNVDAGEISDCEINAVNTGIVTNGARGARIKGCKITLSGAGSAINTFGGDDISNCEFVGPGSGTSSAIASVTGFVGAQGCSFEGWSDICAPIVRTVRVVLRNCTIYNCTHAATLNSFTTYWEMTNCIVHEVTNVFFDASGVFPEETATFIGANVVLRNNIFGTYTDFASVGTTKTYEQFIALNRVDASGDLDATDPLMTDPGAGDFSLQDASPAKWTGRGSGVVTGINAVAFDPNHPDIGAWSSGVIPSPSWTADTSNIVATDLASTGEVGLSWDSADATVLTNLNKGYIVESRVGAGAYSEHFRTTTTSGTVGALTDDIEREFRITAFTRVETEPSDVASDTDTATPTGIDIPEAPEVTATDQLNQSDVLVDIVAGNALDVSTIFYQITPSGVLQTWPTTITGDGSETLTLTVKPYVIYAVAQRGGCNSVASNLVFINVAAANQFTNIRTALREWVKGVVGDPEVLWREPNASQPLRPYVSIKMGPTVAIGSDYHGDNDDTGVETITGDREFVFSVQVHGKPADEDQGEVVSIMERIRSSLEKTSIQDTLSAAGLAFRGVEGSGDLSGIGGTQWEARAFKDFRFGIVHIDTDDVGQISTVETPVGTFE